jgi:hypothetical protein
LKAAPGQQEADPRVVLSWMRDTILLSLTEYNKYFARMAFELSALQTTIGTKADDKAYRYLFQRVFG